MVHKPLKIPKKASQKNVNPKKLKFFPRYQIFPAAIAFGWLTTSPSLFAQLARGSEKSMP